MEIANLAESRPSLAVGDKLIATDPAVFKENSKCDGILFNFFFLLEKIGIFKIQSLITSNDPTNQGTACLCSLSWRLITDSVILLANCV